MWKSNGSIEFVHRKRVGTIVQQLLHAAMENGMQEPGRKLGHGSEYEPSLRHGRMGHYQSGLIDDGIVVQNDIDIDSTGAILFQALPAHFQFNGQYLFEQGQWLHGCMHQQGLIEEGRLIRFAPGSRFINGGNPHQFTDPLSDEADCLVEMLFPVAHIAAYQ